MNSYFQVCKVVLLLLFCAPLSQAGQIDDIIYNFSSFKKCLRTSQPMVCAKERAVHYVNETLLSDEPINFFDMVVVEKNPDFQFKNQNAVLPEEISQRSLVLTDTLLQSFEDFFKSRIFKFTPATAYAGEARKPKPRPMAASMPMIMMMGGGMAMMMGQMMMGKLALIAGMALIMAKMALILSAINGLKKMGGGGGGGGEKHVVVASGGGGGGWERSLYPEEAANMAYKGYNNNV